MGRRFDWYRLGQVNGTGPVLCMIRFYKDEGTLAIGSCQVVEEGKLGAELAALRKLGWLPRAKLLG